MTRDIDSPDYRDSNVGEGMIPPRKSATPKPRAGERVPEFGCNKKTLYAIADLMIENLRGCGESAALVRQAVDERDLLRERGKELVEFAKSVRDWYENAGNSDPDRKSSGSLELWSAAKALLAKHGR